MEETERDHSPSQNRLPTELKLELNDTNEDRPSHSDNTRSRNEITLSSGFNESSKGTETEEYVEEDPKALEIDVNEVIVTEDMIEGFNLDAEAEQAQI